MSVPASEDPLDGAPAPLPLDTDDTLPIHLRRLGGHPVTLSVAATLVIVAFVIGTLAAGALIGLAAAGAAMLVAVAVVVVLASNAAEEDFFKAYADARGLIRIADGELPRATPLLRKGDDRSAEQLMRGTLAGGIPGTLALYTYEEKHRDSDGGQETEYYRYTVALYDLPDVAAKVEQIVCQRRVGFRFLDGAEDVFRRMKRLELESEDLDKRFEVFYGPSDDENWLRQLFSPSFIVWLSDETPDGTAFELQAGSLCVYTKGHHDSATELDGLAEAGARIAARLHEEARE